MERSDLLSNISTLLNISYIKSSFDTSVDRGSGGSENVWGHKWVGGQLAVVLEPGVVTEATHLNPLVRVDRQQLYRNKTQIITFNALNPGGKR